MAELTDYVVGNIRQCVDQLYDYGARNFLLLSPYDLADAAVTPEPGADALVIAYSLALRDALAGFETPGAETYFLDMVELVDGVQANAEFYGFEFLTARRTARRHRRVATR